jgi:hypothetical protein
LGELYFGALRLAYSTRKIRTQTEEELDVDEKALMLCEMKWKNYQGGER